MCFTAKEHNVLVKRRVHSARPAELARTKLDVTPKIRLRNPPNSQHLPITHKGCVIL